MGLTGRINREGPKTTILPSTKPHAFDSFALKADPRTSAARMAGEPALDSLSAQNSLPRGGAHA
jgi:hypothetical protein